MSFLKLILLKVLTIKRHIIIKIPGPSELAISEKFIGRNTFKGKRPSL